ncbi:MAG TPA: glycosyltransferase family A protein, partial [Fibrobacteria bacterium]|nr:glycosyltransferase family A protein [Fibrobacteria bacterium]
LPPEAGVRVHSLPHVSAAHARNHALRHSPTPWLAFSDTDCLLGPDYFAALPGIPARYPGAVAVEGAIRMPGPKPPFTHSLANSAGGTFATANMVFHVASVLALGGFDEGFPANLREDTDLALTILERAGRIPFCRDLAVEHPHLPRALVPSLARAFAHQRRVIDAELRLFEKHPLGYRRVRSHAHVRGTLRAWCVNYTGRFLRQALTYTVAAPGLSTGERIRGLVPAAEEVLVAAWEQACIGVICLARWRRLTRLGSS